MLRLCSWVLHLLSRLHLLSPLRQKQTRFLTSKRKSKHFSHKSHPFRVVHRAGGSMSSGAGCHTFTQNLKKGATGGEVMWVQQFLNGHGFQVSASGAGSPGNETSYFGPATKLQLSSNSRNANAADILTPVGLTSGTGNWFAATRAKANALCAYQYISSGFRHASNLRCSTDSQQYAGYRICFGEHLVVRSELSTDKEHRRYRS
jgi:hypothetical protein